jgi:hypothetical protein
MAADRIRSTVSAVAAHDAPSPEDEFYIGYEAGMPPGIRRVVRPAVALIAVLALAMATVVTVVQRPLADSRFEFGRPREFSGWLTQHPAPSLFVPDAAGRWSRFWLVSQGKFGAARDLGARPDGWVRLSATLIARERWQMLEIVHGSVAAVSRDDTPPAALVTAPVPFRARGEVVDSKCFLGVMNPGERTVHRDCAVRCLAGGVPPMFSYRDADGTHHLALLLTSNGQPVDGRRLAGRPSELAGHLSRTGDIEVLVIP